MSHFLFIALLLVCLSFFTAGTGKTYTMLGTGDHPGTMSLALNEIFALINKGSEKNIYTVTMSYLEVVIMLHTPNTCILSILHFDNIFHYYTTYRH